MKTPGTTRTPRDVAEEFAAVSSQLLAAVRGGDLATALECGARRGALVAELAAFGRPDIVTETLMAAGMKSGAEALELAAAHSAELRRELDSLGRGRQGLKAYGPGPGAQDPVWDLAG